MASAEKWEHSDPRNRIILACAIGSVITLLALKFGFDTYYYGILDRTVEHHQSRYDDLQRIRDRRAAWDRALESGNPAPISVAMERVAAARANIGLIEPRRDGERNDGPLEGWNQRPLPVPPPPVRAARAPSPDGISPDALQQLQQVIIEALQRGGGGQAPAEGGGE